MKRIVILIVVVSAALVAAVLPAAGAGPTVSVKDYRFKPASLTVRHGTTVTFRWAGRALHNVTVKSGPARFHTPTKKTGSFRYRFARKGTYRLICTIHAGMTMSGVVR
jgi:plastocyanin